MENLFIVFRFPTRSYCIITAPSTHAHTYLASGKDDLEHAAALKLAKECAEFSPKFEVYMTCEQWMKWYNRLCQAVAGIATLGAGFTFTVMVSELADPDAATAAASLAKKKRVRFCLALSWVLFVLSLAFASFAALLFNANRRFFSDDLRLSIVAQVYRNELWNRWRGLQKDDKTARIDWLKSNKDPEKTAVLIEEPTIGEPAVPTEEPSDEESDGIVGKCYLNSAGEPRYSWARSWPGRFSALIVLTLQLLPLSAFLASAEAVRVYENALGWTIIGLIAFIAVGLVVFWLAQNQYV